MRTHILPRLKSPEPTTARILAMTFFLLSVTALSSADVFAQCQIGFLPGSAISDASIDGNQGADWNDASILRSGDPCMSFLPDWDQLTVMGGHAVPLVNRSVRVLSKRDTTGTPSLYLAFDIADLTRDRRIDPTPGTVAGNLIPGERIVVQLDPDNAKGPTLASDFRIDVSHIWGNVGGNINFVTKVISDSSGTACAGASPSFANPTVITNSSGGIRISATLNATGYFIEFKIPLSLIGNPTTDVGVAFSIINDLGYHDSDGTDDSAGISFPTALPVVNDANPFFNNCGWSVPSGWGLGYFASGINDVTISRLPVWWSSNAVNAFACGTPNYIYYPVHPCIVTVQATLQNPGAAQKRNLLYLWAEDGANPVVWRVIDLQKNVTVPAGGGVMPISGPLNSPLIKNKPNHPCVRVYILPPVFRLDFTESDILGITSQTRINDMVTAYGLQDQHNAQKNITRHMTTPDCPNTACRIAENTVPGKASPASVAGLRSLSLPAEMSHADYDTTAGSLFTSADGYLPRPVKASFIAPAPAALPQDTQSPLISTTGHEIYLSNKEAAEFKDDNVIVQVRAFGYSKPSLGPISYNFIQELGGVLHLFPLKMFEQQREIPFELNVGNPGTVARTVFLLVDYYVPPGTLAGVTVTLDAGPKEFQPDETKVATGLVKVGKKPVIPPGSFRRWGLSLHGGVSIPHGNFNTVFNPGPNVGVDLEYRVTPTFSLEAIYTYHRFNGETFGSFHVPDLNLHQFSANGKVYGSSSPVRPFFNFGGGAYVFTPGVSTHGGLNVGGGLQFDVNPNFAVDAMYNFHNVFTSGSNTRFSTAQVGVRWRF